MIEIHKIEQGPKSKLFGQFGQPKPTKFMHKRVRSEVAGASAEVLKRCRKSRTSAMTPFFVTPRKDFAKQEKPELRQGQRLTDDNLMN